MHYLFEGGNAVPTSQPVDQQDIRTVVDTARREMPQKSTEKSTGRHWISRIQKRTVGRYRSDD